MLLSVLMPSHRDLAGSRRAIETALAYCAARDAILVVSDNSRDPAKRAALEHASPRLHFTVPEEDGLEANLRNVYARAETDFILMMGDDDELLSSPKDRPVDLGGLDSSFMGARPLVAVANSDGRIVRVKDFGIQSMSPGRRVMEYNAAAKGDNAAYYSIFRREAFIDLHLFFLDHHPVKGGFTDWALACTMFAYGRMAYDPGTIYKYNFHQWDEDAKIGGQMQAMYRDAGLPDSAERYKLLLLFLDLMIMATRRASPLSGDERTELMLAAGYPILGQFCRSAVADPESFGAEVAGLAAAALPAPTPEEKIMLAIEIADSLKPGLADRYRTFRRVAIEA